MMKCRNSNILGQIEVVRIYVPDGELLEELDILKQIQMGPALEPRQNAQQNLIRDLTKGEYQRCKTDPDLWYKAGLDRKLNSNWFIESDIVKHLAHSILNKVRKITKVDLVRVAGHTYSHGNGWIGWHTNSNAAGKRAYCIWNKFSNVNFFRWVDKNERIQTDWEPEGWIIRVFNVPKLPERLWHCIQMQGSRFTLGFAEKICHG